MGNRFSRGRDIPANSAETAAPEQNTAAESAAAQPAEDSVIAQTQQAVATENLDVGILEQVTQLASVGTEHLVLKSQVDEVPDADPEPVAKEPPALVQIEPVLPVCESSAPESVPLGEPKEPPALVQIEPVLPVCESSAPESVPLAEPEEAPTPVQIEYTLPVCQAAPVAEPCPVVEFQLVSEPAPEPDPEPVPEPELVPKPEAEVEAVPEPILESVPAPTEATEQKTDQFSQESLPEPAISSLIDLDVLDQTPQPIDIPPSPPTITAPVDAEEPSDVPVTEECQDSAEISVIPTFEPEKSEETSESEEKPMAAAGNLEQLVSVVSSEENISGLLKNLELTGNDLVPDLISTDVQIPDEMCTSTELM